MKRINSLAAIVGLAAIAGLLTYFRYFPPSSPAPAHKSTPTQADRTTPLAVVTAQKTAKPQPTPPELAQVYAELEDIFLHSEGHNQSLVNSKLRQLNAHSQKLMPQILSKLKTLPHSEQELKRRMAIVDYLRYRMRWDDHLIPELILYIEEPLAKTVPPKIRAIVYADKAELLGGIAAVDADLARETALMLADPLLKNIASYEIYHGLLQRGSDEQLALAFVRSFDISFAP